MHSTVTITFDKSRASDSLSARKLVYNLIDKKLEPFSQLSFKWFSIGGQRSGLLSLYKLGTEKLENEVTTEYEIEVKSIKEKNADTSTGWFDHIYREVFFKHYPDFPGEPPGLRDKFLSLGYTDDAHIVDGNIYKYALLPLYEDKSIDYIEGQNNNPEFITFIDLEKDQVNKEAFVGNKWIVLVDCSN